MIWVLFVLQIFLKGVAKRFSFHDPNCTNNLNIFLEIGPTDHFGKVLKVNTADSIDIAIQMCGQIGHKHKVTRFIKVKKFDSWSNLYHKETTYLHHNKKNELKTTTVAVTTRQNT